MKKFIAIETPLNCFLFLLFVTHLPTTIYRCIDHLPHHMQTHYWNHSHISANSSVRIGQIHIYFRNCHRAIRAGTHIDHSTDCMSHHSDTCISVHNPCHRNHRHMADRIDDPSNRPYKSIVPFPYCNWLHFRTRTSGHSLVRMYRRGTVLRSVSHENRVHMHMNLNELT